MLGIYLMFRTLGNYSTADIMKYALPVAVGSLILNATREKTLTEKLIAKVM